MKKIFTCWSFLIAVSGSFAQVQIDKPIDLNGLGSNAKITGIKDVSDPGDAVSAQVLQSGSLIYAAASGGPNAYTLNLTPALTAYTAGMEIRFRANTGNAAGGTTLKVNALAALTIKKDVGTDLAAGDIQTGQLVSVAYDVNNNTFQLLSRIPDANSGGTVTGVTAASPLTGGTITTSGTIGINQANGSSNGYLSSGDWTNFNTAYTNRITSLTTTGSSGAATLGSNTLNIPNYTLTGLGGVPANRALTINGTALDLSANRSWSVGTVTSVGLTTGTAGSDVNIGAGTSPVTGSGNITLNIPTASGSVRGALSSTDWTIFSNKENALTFSTGLTRSGNTITSNLSTGIAGGQTATGGTASGNNLTLSSTSHATKGRIFFGTSSYNEAANNLTLSNLTGTGNRLVYANASGTLVTGTAVSTPASCKEIKAANPMAGNGVYSIDPDGAGALPAVPCYCDMVTNGGGWTKLNSAITTIASVSKGSAAWNSTNGEDIQGTGNSSGGCGGGGTNVMYTLSTPSVSFTQAYVLLTRSSVMQCSNVTGGTGGGYYSPPYRGTYTPVGMCSWDPPWVNGCCNPWSVAGLPTTWVMFSNASNSALQYTTECSDASDNGAFTMQWFVR